MGKESRDNFELGLRDISYSEVSLPYETLDWDGENKYIEINNYIEDYITQYFEGTKGSLTDVDGVSVSDIGKYERSRKLFSNSTLFEEKTLESIQLVAALQQLIKANLVSEGIEITDLQGMKIKNGVLALYFNNGKNSFKIDLSRKTVGAMFIKEMTKSEIDEIERETLKYEQVILPGGIAATIGYGVYKRARTIREIKLTFDDGEKIINGSFPISINGKIDNLWLLDVLKTQGVEFDPQKRSFVDTREKPISLGKTLKRLKKMKYSQVSSFINSLKELGVKSPEIENITPEKFEEIRAGLIDMVIDIRKNTKLRNVSLGVYLKGAIGKPKYAKLLMGGGLGILGIDTLADAYNDPDDLGAYVRQIAITGGFLTGMRMGRKIPTAWGKIIGGLALGFGTVFGGQFVADRYLQVNNRFTRAYPEREDWFTKYGWDDDFESSVLFNQVTGGILYKVVDGYDSSAERWKNMTGFNAPDMPFIDTEDGLDTFLYNSSIDGSTDPITYMSFAPRNIIQRNKRVDSYTKKLLPQIIELLNKYQDPRMHIGEEGEIKLDKDGNIESEKLFAEEMMSILGDDPEGEWRNPNLRVYDRIMGLFTKENYKQIMLQIHSPGKHPLGNADILTLIEHELLGLKIGQEYYKSYQEDIDFEKSMIEAALSGNTDGIELGKLHFQMTRGTMSQLYINFEELEFLAKLDEPKRGFLKRTYDKTLKREKIITPGVYHDQNGNMIQKDEIQDIFMKIYTGTGKIPPGMIRVTYTPSEDEKMWEFFTGGIDSVPKYQKYISDKKIENSPPNSEPKDTIQIQPSQMFFQFFDKIVEVKKSQVFLDSLQETGDGRKWEDTNLYKK